MRAHDLLGLAALLALTAACSGKDGGTKEPASSYFEDLSPWPTPEADSDAPTSDSAMSLETGVNGKHYACTTTPYDLTRTPEKIVTFNPTVDVLWPGGLVQGGPLLAGTLEALPLTARAPLDVSIPGLLSADNAVTIENPTVATVQEGVGALIDAAVQAGVQPSSSISYTQTEASSASQAALSLGVNASYLGFDLEASLGLSQSADLHSIVGYFVQNMFTVTVPQPETPSDFFAGLTQDDIDAQVAVDHLGPDNLPVYVSSVTYGRVMMFSITSSASTQEIEAALSAQYNGGIGGGGVSAEYSALFSNASTSFHLVTIGGAAADAEAMILSGDPAQFFASDPAISSGVPISYTLRNLGDNSLATVSSTTSYSVRTCVESSVGPGANFYVTNELDAPNGSVLAYSSSGTTFTLASPITGLKYPRGITYDSFNDRLYVVSSDPGVPTGGLVTAYEPDGQPVALGGFTGLAQPQGIFFDPRHVRLYVSNFGTSSVKAYNPDGSFIRDYVTLSPPRDVVYDSYAEQLVVLEMDGTVEVFELNGNPVVSPGGFTGLDSPQAIAYDSHHDRIYISQDVDVTNDAYIDVFDRNGNPVDTFLITNFSFGIRYDDVQDKVYVLDFQDAIMTAFSPDGSIETLPNATFIGMSSPYGIAYRP